MLEDTFGDILGKARWGKGVSIEALATQSGITGTRIVDLEEGALPNGEEVEALASPLGLQPDRLRAIAEERWHPKPHPDWVKRSVLPVQGHIGSYAVWGYLLFDEQTRKAALIDTAHDPKGVLAVLEKNRFQLVFILLTHAHPDHIGGVEEIRRETGAAVYLHPDERATLGRPLDGSVPAKEGLRLSLGPFDILALSTPGHTPGGTTYFVQERERATAFTGDALFAGSVGRSRSTQSYFLLLEGIRKKILTLPEETPLFPGHGPSTTVGQEKDNNPFFP